MSHPTKHNPTPCTHITQDKNMRCWGLLQLLTDIPDATIGVLVGMAGGLLLSTVWGLRVKFSDAVFFYGVLPPIIFCTSWVGLGRIGSRS